MREQQRHLHERVRHRGFGVRDGAKAAQLPKHAPGHDNHVRRRTSNRRLTEGSCGAHSTPRITSAADRHHHGPHLTVPKLTIC